jgi:hypothetical protein
MGYFLRLWIFLLRLSEFILFGLVKLSSSAQWIHLLRLTGFCLRRIHLIRLSLVSSNIILPNAFPGHKPVDISSMIITEFIFFGSVNLFYLDSSIWILLVYSYKITTRRIFGLMDSSSTVITGFILFGSMDSSSMISADSSSIYASYLMA